MKGCKIYIVSYFMLSFFFPGLFIEAGWEMWTDRRLSHGEQTRNVKKSVWCYVVCGVFFCLDFYYMLFMIFFLSVFFCCFFCKFPVAVALFTTSVLCTYLVLWQLYIFESREKIPKQKSIFSAVWYSFL